MAMAHSEAATLSIPNENNDKREMDKRNPKPKLFE